MISEDMMARQMKALAAEEGQKPKLPKNNHPGGYSPTSKASPAPGFGPAPSDVRAVCPVCGKVRYMHKSKFKGVNPDDILCKSCTAVDRQEKIFLKRVWDECAPIVADDLHEGFGVEDIEVRHGIPAEYSRGMIEHWRSENDLRFIRKFGSSVLKDALL